MSDQHPPRSPRPGGPRRPSGSRARAGGSARPVPRQDPRQEQAAQSGSAGAPRGAARPGPAPTRPLPRAEVMPPTPVQSEANRAEAWGDEPPTRTGEHPAGRPPSGPGRSRRRRSRIPRPVRLGATLLVLLLVIVLGWGAGLTLWADSRITHVDALSEAQNTPGTTYLIAGSDGRGGDTVADDGTEGARTDTIMLLHKARGGKSYLISLPRDTLVDIPGYGGYKLNAAFAFGGPKLLVETVEQFTGLTIDHYVEVGFDGVAQVVDAVGHVNLCIDQDVDDERSGLKMTEGCHDVGGEQALAFVRARYFDPTADIGRQQRQQQFVAALMDRVTSPAVILNPISQVRLAGAGSASLTTSEGTGIIDVARMALTARSAMSAGTVTIPIENPEYQTKHSGVAIKTDDAEIAAFFDSVADGSLEPTPAG
ncbi:LCP family protein [Brachybacterium aquaticum]|uniref:LCP family protein required for cell wall assembly n=1 Tax=Brachybacterium aquaticum TaxID=1432564 RepID=A0A841A7U7_9MICO|nr:LCP family protein [Brachybacterium aquaticum]MBB5830916.1 LCP family protein required for cell wall assembly [Brachybacterium aquaticum]